VLIRSASQLRAQIASREVDLQGAGFYATDQNPLIQIKQRELATMQAQLARIDDNGGQHTRLEVSGGKLPGAGLEYTRKLRNVKYHDLLYELIAKQYEAAAIDEARQAPIIQVIDRANAPDKKSGPARLSLIMSCLFLAIGLSSAWVLLTHHIKGVLSRPQRAEIVSELWSTLRIGGFPRWLTGDR
jgi:capsule polysaccharide export protein KpsE/RkpR